MMEHALGPFGRADQHPRLNPLDRQGHFALRPASDGSKDEGGTMNEESRSPVPRPPRCPPNQSTFCPPTNQLEPERKPY
jgi:hypothetical protein